MWNGYSTREASEFIGLPEATIRGCVRAGFVVPDRSGVSLRFSFRDLRVLQLVKRLIVQGVPMRRIRRQLATLLERLPEDGSLSELPLGARDGNVVVNERRGAWRADTGQLVLPFDLTTGLPGSNERDDATPLGPENRSTGDAERGAGASDDPHGPRDASRRTSGSDRPDRIPDRSPDQPIPEAARSHARASGRPDDPGRRAKRSGGTRSSGEYDRLGGPNGARGELHAMPIRRQAPGPSVVAGMNADDWFDRAVALEEIDPPGAIEAYERSLDLRPDAGEAWINLGRLHAESGDSESAQECFHRALTLDPADATALYNLGVVAQDGGNDEEAIGHYRHALRLEPGLAEAHYNLATIYDRRGETTTAIRHINEYRKLTR